MMKIQTSDCGGEIVLQVVGRLAGAFVPELEAAWKSAQASAPGRRIVVDLKDVTCVDRAGRLLLRAMHDGGAGFAGACLATQDMLEQILERHECQ